MLLKLGFNSLIGILAKMRQPKGLIAMLHYGRCGSTVLGDLLNQHPEILWDSEIFDKMLRNKLFKDYWRSDPIRLLRIRMLLAGNQHYGFETKCHPLYDLRKSILNMSVTHYLETLKQLGYRNFIVLKRRNYLRQQVSIEVAWQNNQAWHQPAQAKATLKSIRLDVDKVWFGNQKPLLESFEERDQGYAELESLLARDRTLHLTYEDHILPDPVAGYRQVCEFIEVQPCEVTIKRSRTNPFSLKDIIQNFSEIEAHLQNTNYEWMLYD